MDSKKAYFSSKITLKCKALSSTRSLNDDKNTPFTNSKVNPRKPSEDPFESMVRNSKSHQVLLPVLNKHRKYPSIPSFRSKDLPMTDRNMQNSLNLKNSEVSLPKIQNTNYLIQMKPKLKLIPFLNPEKNQEITTPSFANQPFQEFDSSAHKKSKKKLEAARSYKNFNEISFGGKD
jgi:hypothetical protein